MSSRWHRLGTPPNLFFLGDFLAAVFSCCIYSIHPCYKSRIISLKVLLVLNEFKEFAEKKFTRMGCNHFCISQPTSSLPLTPLSKVLTSSKIYLWLPCQPSYQLMMRNIQLFRSIYRTKSSTVAAQESSNNDVNKYFFKLTSDWWGLSR